MNRKLLSDLIAQGENEKVDFKRELRLDSSDEKAEFIKDLIAVANSVPDQGYLIIGVDNSKNHVGISSLEEERIQQIAHTYVYPSIIVHCYRLRIDSALIGVIEVIPTEKPHQVIRGIGRLLLNDVFIRHGSVTAKASPSEIARMRDRETGLSREIRQLSSAAEKHLHLGNIDQTLVSYTKAIELMPTPELLLLRAQVYKRYFSPDTVTDYLEVEKGELSLKDLSNALMLTDSLELQKKIRLERLQLFSICPLEDKSWEDDLSWAAENLEDKEYAVVMFYAARKMEVFAIYANEGWDSNKIIEYIDDAVGLGYKDPKAHYLRASAHFANNNDGLALYDINLAVSLIGSHTRLLVDFLNLRVAILKNMAKYAEAYDDLERIYQLAPENVNEWLLADIHHLTDEILHRVCIQWKFGYGKKDIGIYKYILTLLILNKGLPKMMQFESGEAREFDRGIHIEKELPYVAPVLREIVGQDIWEAAKRGDSFYVNISPKRQPGE